MKTNEYLKSLRAKTAEELAADLKEKKSELLNLRFQQATGQLENTSAIKECKKEIARIYTVIRQAELAKQA